MSLQMQATHLFGVPVIRNLPVVFVFVLLYEREGEGHWERVVAFDRPYPIYTLFPSGIFADLSCRKKLTHLYNQRGMRLGAWREGRSRRGMERSG